MNEIRYEICCGSAGDVIAANAGGAHRVELNSDLFHGGLTPTVGSLLLAKKYTAIPVMCMVRPREGGFCYTGLEFEVMLQDARILLDNGADGIVFGFLRQDGSVDEERTAAMLEVIGSRESVFHRAIDVVPDLFGAMDLLIRLGVRRILTSGQRPTVPEGIGRIRDMLRHAAGRVEVLPGGGIDLGNAAWCAAAIGSDFLHLAIQRTAYDTSCHNNPSIYFGGCVYPSEDRYPVADAEKIAALCRGESGPPSAATFESAEL